MKQRYEDLLQEPEKQMEEDLLAEPVKQSGEDLLQEPEKQRESNLLQEPEKQREAYLLQEPMKQREKDRKDWREKEKEMQKARQEHMIRQQRWKKERLRKMFTPGQSWFISEDEPRRRGFGGRRMRNKTSSEDKKEENTDMENKQDHLQGLSWPVSSNGEGLLISVKPLHPCAEPEEEPRALTPSTADHNTDHTMEDSVGEQEITTAPEEPGPQPQAFSEPQRDNQIFTDGSKLTSEEKNEAEEATSSQVDNLKQSVLQAFSRGTMVQCFVQRDRTDKSGPTYHMFRETEDGKKVRVVRDTHSITNCFTLL